MLCIKSYTLVVELRPYTECYWKLCVYKMLFVFKLTKCENLASILVIDSNAISVFALIFFHLLAQKPNLDNFYIFSNKFFHNFYLFESSFTCPELRARG